MQNKVSNNVARFLYTLRIDTGMENIREYLRKYNLPISDNYYRDVESGRKRLSLEKALELTEKLPFKSNDGADEFIWHFLRDSLPNDLSRALLLPRVDKSFSSPKEAMELLRRDLNLYRNSAVIREFEDNYISNDEVYTLLADNIDLLPILHHIYMVENTDEIKIKTICENAKIDFDLERIGTIMAKCGVEVKEFGGRTRFKRARSIFRVAPTPGGLRLLERFTEHELKTSKTKDLAERVFDPNGTFSKSAIISVSSKRAEQLRARLQDFLAEMTLAKDQLNSTDAEPYFVMCVVSGRPEYNPK